MNIVFIEDFNNDFINEALTLGNDQIIALTPMVMYRLDKRKIKYKIPEDYYVYQEGQDYEKWFCSLMDYFQQEYISNYFGNNIILNMNPPFIYHFLTMFRNVIDAFIRRYQQFEQIIELEKPDSIWYFTENKRDIIDSELYFKTKSIMQSIVEYYCHTKNIKLQVVTVKNEQQKQKKKIKDNQFLRLIYNYFRSYMFLPSFRCEKVLFADWIPDRIRECKLSDLSVKVLSEPKIKFVEKNCKFLIGPLFELFEKINIESRLANHILKPRFYYFVEKIMPEVFAYTRYFIDYFEKNKFDCIVFNRRNKLYHYGALIAAKYVELKSCYIRHGWDLYDVWIRKYNHFGLYDYHVCADESDVEFFKNKVKEWNLETKVL